MLSAESASGRYPVEAVDVPEMTDLASSTVLAEGFGEAGQSIVISAGLPFLVARTNKLLRIAQIP
ncbi:hypothetical protein AU476_23070 [Cupriavidus sp. UYMSc13B]|nr:hypothetical protein AU476_23070 [Cupriavidus sp. UYMSc13B]